jgi:hypothetical protein
MPISNLIFFNELQLNGWNCEKSIFVISYFCSKTVEIQYWGQFNSDIMPITILK